MITFVFTYRNRATEIVAKCLESLNSQSNLNFKVIVVDYGSDAIYSVKLNQLVSNYEFASLISVPVSGQLWNKSRAINIALKQTETPYFFVGDVDMIFHSDFVKTLSGFQHNHDTTYFQVGFLSEHESKLDKKFEDYEIGFYSSEEATGMTLFTTESLMSINGFDEFYHGWGSEDTDVHVRLLNAGFTVDFYEKNLLLLHQWHPKLYRSLNDEAPFHSTLEQINAAYLDFTRQTKKTKANLNFDWGELNEQAAEDLITVDQSYEITNKEAEFKAFVASVLCGKQNAVVHLIVNKHEAYRSLIQTAKSVLNKKTISFLEMDTVNNLLLEAIVFNLRNAVYSYRYNRVHDTISLLIKL